MWVTEKERATWIGEQTQTEIGQSWAYTENIRRGLCRDFEDHADDFACFSPLTIYCVLYTLLPTDFVMKVYHMFCSNWFT